MPDESRPISLDKGADAAARASGAPEQGRAAEAEKAFRVPTFRRLQIEQIERPNITQALVARDKQVRADLTRQVSALRENIRLRVEQLCKACSWPQLSANGPGAVQRRIELGEAATSVERLLERALHTLAEVHDFERVVAVKRSAKREVSLKTGMPARPRRSTRATSAGQKRP